MKVIGTHENSLHADDAMGAAILNTLYPDAEIVRSRDPAVWATCDALVDVGGEYDPLNNRFDHHQKGFNEKRINGLPYAGAGLVWRTYGVRYTQAIVAGLSDDDATRVANLVDERLMQHIDAVDSGIDVPGPSCFNLSGILDTFNAQWNESGDFDLMRFNLAMAFCGTVLSNLVRAVAAEHAAAEIVRKAPTLMDGKILVLDVARLPYDPVVNKEFPQVLFVVYPASGNGKQYQVRVVPKVLGAYQARADLPAEWAGLRDADLAAVTGVADAVFAHNGRFICGAGSKEGALRMAELAVAAL